MIEKIFFKSFRCLDDVIVSFDSYRLISIFAKNNMGKTSMLEACGILSDLVSFHASNLGQVVSFNRSYSIIGIQLNHTHRCNYYLKITNKGEKFISVDGRTNFKKKDIDALYKTMYISSDSLFLVTSSPRYRRHLLDRVISDVSLQYAKELLEYKRLISQKNRLLKSSTNKHLAHSLNRLISPKIESIMSFRKKALMYLNDCMNDSFDYFSCVNGQVSIQYQSSIDYSLNAEEILRHMNQCMDKEFRYHCSLFGPHRDDFSVCINNRLCRDFYSRGICRYVGYLFQLACVRMRMNGYNGGMLLLLDEPFAEIHDDLKSKLIRHIPKSCLTIYTTSQENESNMLTHSKQYGLNYGVLCTK